MNDFTLPANIKQIGSIGDGLRIYMEDYVCTFLQQYAEAAGFEERLAFLVGKSMMIDGQSFLFIAGAIHGKHTEKHDGILRFTEKSVDYAEDMIEEHFPGMEAVGWMQSQPSYGTYLNQQYAAYHLRQFRKAEQVMFVIDPLERTSAFYAANPTALTPADRMAEISGYFIYYEKNTNMHEYMLANKSVDYTAKPPTLVELTPLEYSTGENGGEDEPEEDGYAYSDRTPGRFSMGGPRPEGPRPEGSRSKDITPEEQIRRHRARRRMPETRRATNLLAGLCAVLFIISFVMGTNLIRNQDRIERMEGEMRQLTTAHRNLSAQLAEPAFAEAYVRQAPIPTPSPAPEAAATPAPPPTPPPAAAQPTPEPSIAAAPGEEAALIPAIPETYTIQPGDSLIAISVRFFGDAGMVSEILALNGIEDADHIVAGRTIALPRR